MNSEGPRSSGREIGGFGIHNSAFIIGYSFHNWLFVLISLIGRSTRPDHS